MALESATYINGLVTTNPPGSDPLSDADGHLRLLKSTIKTTFPNITGAVTVTQAQLNNITNAVQKDGSVNMTGALTLSGDPTSDLHAVPKQYVAAKSTTITGTDGLAGGGDLSDNRTLNIADGGVSTAKIADSAVTTAKIADTAITTAKITDANVTPAKLSQPLTLGTAVATTSGNSVEFTGIPSWAKRITVMFQGVSTSGGQATQIQLGTSSGYTTTGYLNGYDSWSSTPSTAASTTGLVITDQSSGQVYHGMAVLCKLSGNNWVFQATGGLTNGSGLSLSGGSIAMSGVVDRLRVNIVGGTEVFDAGSVNIMYE